MQHEIQIALPLLNRKGSLTDSGWARDALPIYRRADVRGSRLRIKEWDHYLVSNSRFALSLTISNYSYMKYASASLIDFVKRSETTKSTMPVISRATLEMSESSLSGNTSFSGPGFGIFFNNDSGRRTLICHVDKFGGEGPLSAKILLPDEPAESIVTATPFEKPNQFYYNRKILGMSASGEVIYGGKTWEFDAGDSAATLNWGRGIWPRRSVRYWSAGYGELDGAKFGFNLGYGYSKHPTTENAIFYNGVIHKLEKAVFYIPVREGARDYLAPWRITSSDGRIEMDFEPQMDRSQRRDTGLFHGERHQVFGNFSGTATLDDGTVLEIRDFFGFVDSSENKW